ncbi:MAG: VWA domain-containing protein [Muribaculaceae bacterium]|jgi:Ca-activated chloride channel family protein|nr:VWA domain-containing protein [Muribaculaceae bacterium]
MIHLARPYLLWLFLLFVPLIAWYVYHYRNSEPTMRVSSTRSMAKLPTSWKVWFKHLMFAVQLAALGCLIVILCRPQSHDSWATSDVEGTDIMVALDVSTSMLAKDFTPNRLEAAKDVATRFVTGRDHDNIGLVLFAGESFTQVPMTMDNATLVNAIQGVNVSLGYIEDGTAIGDGIATAINRIKDGKAVSKSIILLTDGSNNTGVVAPLTAAEIAKRFDIKIYTIGVGSNGSAPYPVAIDYAGNIQYQTMPVVIDEATLQQIANATGGKYFRATSKGTLASIFKEIDTLEKTHMDVQRFSHTEDHYHPWAIALLVLLLVWMVGEYTVLRHIP